MKEVLNHHQLCSNYFCYSDTEKDKVMSRKIIVPEEVVLSKIFEIRGEKVMIDRDLAELYGG